MKSLSDRVDHAHSEVVVNQRNSLTMLLKTNSHFLGVTGCAVLAIAATLGGSGCKPLDLGDVLNLPSLQIDQAPAAKPVASVDLAKPVSTLLPMGRYGFALQDQGGVELMDFNDPSQPASVASVDTKARVVAMDFDPSRGLAYLVDASGAVRVLNILAIDSPSTIGSAQLPSGAAVATGISRVLDRLFVVAAGQLYSFALSDQGGMLDLAAARTTSLSSAPTQIAAGGGALYFAFASGKLEAWSADATPARLGSIDLGGQPTGLVVNGSLVFATAAKVGLAIVDFGAPKSPVMKGKSAELSDVQSLRLFGRTLVASLDRGSVTALDISDSAAPRAVSTNKNFKAKWVNVVNGNLVYGSGKTANVAAIPPHVVGRIDAALCKSFPRYGRLPMRFSKPIDAATAAKVKLRCAGAIVAGHAVVDADGLGFTFQPDTMLPGGASCELDLSTVRDVVGSSLSMGSAAPALAFQTSVAAPMPIMNPGSKFPHAIDGAFTGFKDTSSTGYEWSDVTSAQGMFTKFYADFDGKNLWILNDWTYRGERVNPDCYNLFNLWTSGGTEQWEIRAYGDQHVEVRKNGQLVDAKAAGVKGGASFGASPNLDTPHTIYEIGVPAGAGGWGVRLHDPGPTFQCSRLEGEPTGVAASSTGSGKSSMTMLDPSLQPKAPNAPVLVDPKADATGVAVNSTLRWSSKDSWQSFVGYVVELSHDASFTRPIRFESGSTSLTLPLGVLRASTAYQWRVTAVNAAGYATSAPLSFTTQGAATCTKGTADCDGDATNGCEVSLASSASHCGACFAACAKGVACQSGVCGRAVVGNDAGVDSGKPKPVYDASFSGSDDAGGNGNKDGGVVAMSGNVLHIAAGYNHTCAVQRDGLVYCFGSNSAGQLGTGNTSVVTTWNQVPGVSSVAILAAGNSFTCSSAGDGVKCWGGIGGTSLLTATSMGSLVKTTAISAGASHACSISSGIVYCWGANDSGQLGDGTTTSSATTPVAVTLPGQPLEVAAGNAFTCALTTTGVYCWGLNDSGQCGSGDTMERHAPFIVTSSSVQHIAAGGGHACLVIQGSVSCWGSNGAGQLGVAANDAGVFWEVSPAAYVAGPNVVEIALGDGYSCARRNDGTVLCWGAGDSGQLGDGMQSSRYTPVAVSGLVATSMALGGQHTCALKTGATGAGVALCWGTNNQNECGDGNPTKNPILTPAPVIW